MSSQHCYLLSFQVAILSQALGRCLTCISLNKIQLNTSMWFSAALQSSRPVQLSPLLIVLNILTTLISLYSQLCPSTQGVHWALHGFRLPFLWPLSSLNAVSWDNHRALLNCLSYVRDHDPSLPDIHFLKKYYFMYLSVFSFFPDKRVNLVHSISVRSDVLSTTFEIRWTLIWHQHQGHQKHLNMLAIVTGNIVSPPK